MPSAAESEPTVRFDLLKLAPRAARTRRRASRVSVVVRRPKQPEFELALDQDSTLIGRDPSCDIVLDDDGISRRHARIDLLDTGYHELVDLSSTNGTLVAGRPLQRMILLDGDRFAIGDTRFTFRSSPIDDGGSR
ncbi:MAG: FHA domain-containing protein [Myxococcota bacterium]